jgi:hypothetical protein
VDSGGDGKMKTGDRIGVSDISGKIAREDAQPSIFLANVGGADPFICVYHEDEHLYPNGNYRTETWKYGVEIQKPKLRPWCLEDNVVNRVIRWKGTIDQHVILKAGEFDVELPDGWNTYKSLLGNCEWLDGDEWKPCGVEE